MGEIDLYRQIIELASIGIVVIGFDGIVKVFNPKSCEIFGYEASDVIGKRVEPNFYPDPEALQEAQRIKRLGVLLHRHSGYFYSFVHHGEKGRMPIALSVAHIYDPDRNEGATVSFVRELSDDELKAVLYVPKVFVSYSHQDTIFVERLVADLTRNKINVWLDQWEIEVGESIIARIEEGISACDFLLVVLSKSSVDSSWVRVELDSMRMSEISAREVTVLPVLIEDCTLPPLLRTKKYADFRGDYQRAYDQLERAIRSLMREKV